MSGPFGFIEFGAADPSIVLSCRPNSLAAVQATGGALAGANTANARFDAERGFYQVGAGTTSTGLIWDVTDIPSLADLANGGHVTFWVEPAFLITAGNGNQETLLQFANSSGSTVAAAYRGTSNVFPQVNAAALYDYIDAGVSNLESYSVYGETRAQIPVTISWDRGISEIYIDGCLVQRKSVGFNSGVTPHYLGVWAASRVAIPGQSGIQQAGGALHSFHISNRPIKLPFHRTKVVNFGDSFTSRGGASTWTPYNMIATLNDGAAGIASAGQHQGAGYIMGMRRLFAEHGYMLPFYNYGQGGQQSSDFAAKVAVWAARGITDNWVGTAMYGINDALQTQESAATFRARMISGLDAAFTAGASKMVVLKPPSPANDPTYNTPTITGLIDAYGNEIDDLRTSYPDMIVGDALTALGGHITQNPLYQINGVHPNNNGQMALSRLINPLLERAVF